MRGSEGWDFGQDLTNLLKVSLRALIKRAVRWLSKRDTNEHRSQVGITGVNNRLQAGLSSLTSHRFHKGFSVDLSNILIQLSNGPKLLEVTVLDED